MKVVHVRGFGEVHAEETDLPGVIEVHLDSQTFKVAACALCGEYDAECHVARTGHLVCEACAGHLANLWNYERSGHYLTWPNAHRPTRTGRNRALISAAVRNAVLLRDHYRCRYCGGFEGGLVLDHVRPWSRGGPDTTDNLVAACVPCNRLKSDQTPEEAGMRLREVEP